MPPREGGSPRAGRRQLLQWSGALGAGLWLPRLGRAALPARKEDGPDGAQAAGAAMRQAARALAAQADAGERAALLLDFGAPERHRWRYTPGTRPGLPLGQMQAQTRRNALRLLEAGLSETGRAKALGVMTLAAVLRPRRAGGAFSAEDGQAGYAVAVFGDPARAGPWGWRLEGHHLSLNYTLLDDQLLSATPHCVCADPAEVHGGPAAGLAVLHREDYMGRDLARSLDARQIAQAALETAGVPDNILTGPGQARLPEAPGRAAGLAHAELAGETQRHVMLAIADCWFANLPPALARRALARLRAQGLDGLRFQWAGGFGPGDLHYYRLRGAGVQIEYATRRRADHVHAVWREPGNDFGLRALRGIGGVPLPPARA